MSAIVALGRRFARLATTATVRAPWLWRLFRRPLARQFDWLAPRWDSIGSPDKLAPVEAALDRLLEEPARIVDVGTGTGDAALLVARRFEGAQVIGVDLSQAMVDEARRKLPSGLAARVRFEQADSARLPYADGSFDLAVLANMIPFFDELGRVVAPGGHVLLAFSSGPQTPIYVPPRRLRDELGRRGFADFEELAAGHGTALLARRVEVA